MFRVRVRHPVMEALLASGRLSDAEGLDRARVEREIAEVLAEWAARWVE